MTSGDRKAAWTRLETVEELARALCRAAGAPHGLVQAHLEAIEAGDPARIESTKMALVRALPGLKKSTPSM